MTIDKCSKLMLCIHTPHQQLLPQAECCACVAHEGAARCTRHQAQRMQEPHRAASTACSAVPGSGWACKGVGGVHVKDSILCCEPCVSVDKHAPDVGKWLHAYSIPAPGLAPAATNASTQPPTKPPLPPPSPAVCPFPVPKEVPVPELPVPAAHSVPSKPPPLPRATAPSASAITARRSGGVCCGEGAACCGELPISARRARSTCMQGRQHIAQGHRTQTCA